MMNNWLVRTSRHPCEPCQAQYAGIIYGDGAGNAYPTYCPPWHVDGWLAQDAHLHLADHSEGEPLGVPFCDPEIDRWIAEQYDIDILDLEPDIYDELQNVRG